MAEVRAEDGHAWADTYRTVTQQFNTQLCIRLYPVVHRRRIRTSGRAASSAGASEVHKWYRYCRVRCAVGVPPEQGVHTAPSRTDYTACYTDSFGLQLSSGSLRTLRMMQMPVSMHDLSCHETESVFVAV